MGLNGVHQTWPESLPLLGNTRDVFPVFLFLLLSLTVSLCSDSDQPGRTCSAYVSAKVSPINGITLYSNFQYKEKNRQNTEQKILKFYNRELQKYICNWSLDLNSLFIYTMYYIQRVLIEAVFVSSNETLKCPKNKLFCVF